MTWKHLVVWIRIVKPWIPRHLHRRINLNQEEIVVKIHWLSTVWDDVRGRAVLVCWTPGGILPAQHSYGLQSPHTFSLRHFSRFIHSFIYKIYHGIIPVVALSIFVKLEYLRFLGTLTTTGSRPDTGQDWRLSCPPTLHQSTPPCWPASYEQQSQTESREIKRRGGWEWVVSLQTKTVTGKVKL